MYNAYTIYDKDTRPWWDSNYLRFLDIVKSLIEELIVECNVEINVPYIPDTHPGLGYADFIGIDIKNRESAMLTPPQLGPEVFAIQHRPVIYNDGRHKYTGIAKLSWNYRVKCKGKYVVKDKILDEYVHLTNEVIKLTLDSAELRYVMETGR